MKNNKIMLVIGAVALVLVLLCGGLFLKDYKKKKPEEISTPQQTTEFSLDSMNEDEEDESLKIEDTLEDDGFSALIPLN